MTINLPPIKLDSKVSKQPVTKSKEKLKQQPQQEQGVQCSKVKRSNHHKKRSRLTKLLTSQLLMDDYPSLPLNIHSEQPVISITKDKNLTTPILYLTASSFLYPSSDQTVNDVSGSSVSITSSATTSATNGGHINSISGIKDLSGHLPTTASSSVSQISSSDSKTDDKQQHHQPHPHPQQQHQHQQQQQQQQGRQSRMGGIFHPSKRIFPTPLIITNFRPLLAPFVPIFIKILVNQIEAECYQTTWNLIFDDLTDSYEEARVALIKLIYYWYNEVKLKHIIGKLRLDVKIMTLRLFLNELEKKLLNFSRSSTMCMVQSPLLDLFLRPNKQIRCIVQHTALSQSCVQMDTLAFIMIHLLHAWESSVNPIEGKVSLGRIYGRLLISFSDKPELRGLEQGVGDHKTIESILFEVILELCDFHFWQQLTMLKIRSVFEYISDMEKRFARDFRKRQQESMMIQYKSKVSDENITDDGCVQVDDSSSEEDVDEKDDDEDEDQQKDGGKDAGCRSGGGRGLDDVPIDDAVDHDIDAIKKNKLEKRRLSNKALEKLNKAEKDLKELDGASIMDIFPSRIRMTNSKGNDSMQIDPNLTCEMNGHRKRTHYFSSTATLPLIIPFVELSLLGTHKEGSGIVSSSPELYKSPSTLRRQLKFLCRSTDQLYNEINASRTKTFRG